MAVASNLKHLRALVTAPDIQTALSDEINRDTTGSVAPYSPPSLHSSSPSQLQVQLEGRVACSPLALERVLRDAKPVLRRRIDSVLSPRASSSSTYSIFSGRRYPSSTSLLSSGSSEESRDHKKRDGLDDANPPRRRRAYSFDDDDLTLGQRYLRKYISMASTSSPLDINFSRAYNQLSLTNGHASYEAFLDGLYANAQAHNRFAYSCYLHSRLMDTTTYGKIIVLSELLRSRHRGYG